MRERQAADLEGEKRYDLQIFQERGNRRGALQSIQKTCHATPARKAISSERRKC